MRKDVVREIKYHEFCERVVREMKHQTNSWFSKEVVQQKIDKYVNLGNETMETIAKLKKE